MTLRALCSRCPASASSAARPRGPSLIPGAAKYLKTHQVQPLISFIGSYVQALPKKALEDEPAIDFVFTNEGVYSLRNILKLEVINENYFSKINKN